MISAILSRLVILLFGTLYPAYASYKAVRTKNVKEYVKWMMYWIVFALFTCAETFTDLFLSFWFPFYYEIKIVLVIWLLSPATKGSSILYRNFVHPALIKREQEIDEYISKAKEQGYHTMLHLGSKGVTYATNVIMQTAIKGGGGIVNHLRRSYSLSDLSDDSDLKADMNRNSKLQGDAVDTADVPRDPRMRALRKPGGSHVDLYFPEMDVDVRSHSHDLPVSLSQIRSSEDISSGYSSAEPLFVEGQVVPEGNPLMRTASVGATRARARGGRTIAQPKKILTTEEEEDAFSADYGWPHALPPYQIASFLPELLSLDPSGTLPSQPFLNPEALKLIYANSVLRNQVLLNISEIKEEEKAIVNDSKSVKRDEIFEDTADLGDLPKDKPNYTPESHESISINNGKPVESNVSSFESTTNEKVTFESTEIQAAVKTIGSEIQSTAVLLNDIDKFEAAEEEFAVKVIDPEIPSNITSNETVAIEATGEKTDAKEIDSEIPSTKDMSVASEDAIKSTPEEEVEQTNDCFEDASDAEISAIVDGRDLNSSIENKSEFSQINSLKPTGSSESLSSSEDHCFEDSLPDVAIVTRSDSFNVGDRKGKYNKSRAPLPPEVNKVDEGKVNFGDSLIPPNSNILVEPDLLLGSTTPPCEVINSEITNSKNHSNSKEENHLQEAERQSLSSLYGKRDVSPSPSSQSKKGHSNFTRFLPKTGVTSLFNFWGPKEDPTGNKSRGKSVAKSSWSPSSEMFHSQRSSSPNFPNIDYSPEGSDVGSSNSEINSGKTTPKIKIRQMSHSPSRRRHYN